MMVGVMNKGLLFLAVVFLAGAFSPHIVAAKYGEAYCTEPGFYCVTAVRGDTWKGYFPDDYQRNIVRRLNRTNSRLRTGQVIAIPESIETLTEMELSPFPKKIAPSSANRIVVDQSELAWGGYDADGNLLKWGPISGGKAYCRDVKRECRTRPGYFVVYHKRGAGCKSKKFPIGKGGAKMPYCMFYDGGFAIHGSYNVPGYNDSHGCVRVFNDDARWLNSNFVTLGETWVIIDRPIPGERPTKETSSSSASTANYQWH